MSAITEKLWTPGHDVVGTAKLELFDERTGRLYHCEEKENFISQAQLAYQKWNARRAFWSGLSGSQVWTTGNGAQAAGITSQIDDPFNGLFWTWTRVNNDPNTPSRGAAPLNDIMPPIVMTHLALFNDTTAESASTEKFPRFGPTMANLAAWANLAGYAGTDTKRGTQDLVLSQADATQAKWVFNWGTTQGNGIQIASIGWCRMNENTLSPRSSGSIPVFASRTQTTTTGPDQTDKSRLAYDPVNDRVYAMGTNSNWSGLQVFWITAADLLAGLSNWTRLYAAPASTADDGFFAFDGANQQFWTSTTASNPMVLRKHNLSDGSVAATVNVASLTAYGEGYTGDYDGTNLYVANINNSGVVYKINPATGALVTSWDTGMGTNLRSVACRGDGTVVVTQETNNMSKVYSSTGTLLSELGNMMANMDSFGERDTTWLRGSSGLGRDLGIGANSGRFSGGNSQGWNSFDITSLGTRVLLGTPVTKDSSKTMRVTYTFAFS